MKNANELIKAAKAAAVPVKYELKATDLNAIQADTSGDFFETVSLAFQIGFMQGQKAGKVGK